MKKHLQENKNAPSKLFTLMCNGIFKKKTQPIVNVGGMYRISFYRVAWMGLNIDNYPGFQPKIKPDKTYATQCTVQIRAIAKFI